MSTIEIRKQKRSSEELEMRALIVPELRKRYPGARIIHELPLRYSARRLDLAAVTRDHIVTVEIKSSRDTTDRLEGQLRGFLPVSHRIIVALAPMWLVRPEGRFCSETEELIRRVCGYGETEIWRVNTAARTITTGDIWEAKRFGQPWHSRLLDMLHVAELLRVAERHRICLPLRANHYDLVRECNALMTGREVVRAVCRALRERPAFARESDPPIIEAAQ